jgi:uncharacterized protein (TIGR03435 family)
MMKKRTLSIPAVAIAATIALHAQSINDTWQGKLNAGVLGRRIVVKISNENDKPKATMYLLDQGGQTIPASSVSREGSTVKFAISSISGNFEGKLSADGTTIAGTWSQGGPAQPLVLTRATNETAWAIPEPPPPKTMPADANPSFEVSTIKPAKPDEPLSLQVTRSAMLNTTNISVVDLIKFAYDLHPKQITGGQSWTEMEKYDIVGKPDTAGFPSIQQLKGMVQKLLAERFALAFHREKREMSVYAITLAKGGHKMTENKSNPNGLPGFTGGGVRGMRVVNSTMAEWGSIMQATALDKPVVDQTGLGSSRWDFFFRWTPDPSMAPPGARQQPAAAANPDAPPDLFFAVYEQLGLKLEVTKAPIEVVAIDRLEKPTEN